jgi:hypothetical protein
MRHLRAKKLATRKNNFSEPFSADMAHVGVKALN